MSLGFSEMAETVEAFVVRTGEVVVEGAGSPINELGANGRGGTDSGVRAGSSSSLFNSGVLGTTLMPPTIAVSFWYGGGAATTKLSSAMDGLRVCLGVTGIGVIGVVAEVLGCVHEVGDFVVLSFSVE